MNEVSLRGQMKELLLYVTYLIIVHEDGIKLLRGQLDTL